MRVVVSFGGRLQVGIVAGVSEWDAGSDSPPPDKGLSSKLKAVEACLDDGSLLPLSWRELLEFCSNYYHYPLGTITLEALPKALRTLNQKGAEPVMVAKARKKILEPPQIEAPPTEQQPTEQQPTEQQPTEQQPTDQHPTDQHPTDEKPLDTREISKQQSGEPEITPAEVLCRPDLNAEQKHALAQLKTASGFEVTLLYGITGSGKTEVYLNLIEWHLERGQQALVLLPEINLTPAALELYRIRFNGHQVVVLHSELSETERTQSWFQAASGLADVVIGTRLGVLTPLPRLGLVVVDEEHDPSFKQQEGMKYNARDVAIVLGKQRNIPVLLGSATPSLESWAKVEKGDYRRLELKQRAALGAVLPSVELINTANFTPKNGLSEPVIVALKECLASGQQAIVFLNRRGYSPQLACDACGWVAGCPHCSAMLVWHKAEGAVLRCHHCGSSGRLPSACPTCGNQDLTGFGRGTQRIEETLQGLFPDEALLRLDADSTRRKGSMQDLLKQVHAGDVKLMVGTQMIAKGHDFARVGLVVALNVDSSLFSQSFRAPERLFAQLMQVAGRAGRRGGGKARMLVQTRYPDHPLFKALVAHDYEQFAGHELAQRKAANMPPYSFQVLMRADHRRLEVCLDFLRMARDLGISLADGGAAVYFADPVPLTVVKVANVERAHLLVESESRPALQRLVRLWIAKLSEQKTPVKWFVEVDPADL